MENQNLSLVLKSDASASPRTLADIRKTLTILENTMSILHKEIDSLELMKSEAPHQSPQFKIPSRVGMMDIEMLKAVVCHCGQRYIDPNSRQHWYYSTHSERECLLELPDKMCWCGLLRSQHIDGHREGGQPEPSKD